MLTLAEKILFAIAVLVSLYFTYRGVDRIVEVVGKAALFQPVFRLRRGVSILHAFIGWGLLVYLLINLTDVIYAYTGIKLLHHLGLFGDLYRLLADFFGVAIMV